MVNEQTKRLIQEEAGRQGVPESQIVREAIECYIECLDLMDRPTRPERRIAKVSP